MVAPRPAPRAIFPRERKRPPQQARGFRNASFGHGAAHGAAGYNFAINDYRRDNFDRESKLAADLLKPRHVTGLAVSKSKILPHQNGAGAQPVRQNATRELLGR